MITITFPDNKTIQAENGTTLEQLLGQIEPPARRPLAAIVNGMLQELHYPLLVDSSVTWVDFNSNHGWRIYRRSVILLLQLAVKQLFPKCELFVSHSLKEGCYCFLQDGRSICPVSAEQLRMLEEQMKQYVAEDLRFERSTVSREDAAQYFRSIDKNDTAQMIEKTAESTVNLYSVGDVRDYCYGPMAPSAGYVNYFYILPLEEGFLINLPAREYLGCVERDDFAPKQLQTTLMEYHDWSDLMGIRTVSDLNRVAESSSDDFTELVLVSETLQERNLHRVSDDIFSHFPEVRLVLLAGPSCSGKTTTTRRLGIQFRTLGLHPVMISLDDYFKNRNETPLDAYGKPDYEGLAALQIDLFQQNMRDLIEGREARLPKYDFVTGTSHLDHRRLRLRDDQIIIVEGIHALNEDLSADIPHKNKRKIFISALTQLNLDDCTPVSASDNRLLRRIVRDMQFRNKTPEQTLDMWDSVRRGEHANIFPFQEEADFFLNSVLIYELPVLRPLVEDALSAVKADSPHYLEACRLLQLIRYFSPATGEAVPRNSILQEFLGNSLFDVG